MIVDCIISVPRVTVVCIRDLPKGGFLQLQSLSTGFGSIYGQAFPRPPLYLHHFYLLLSTPTLTARAPGLKLWTFLRVGFFCFNFNFLFLLSCPVYSICFISSYYVVTIGLPWCNSPFSVQVESCYGILTCSWGHMLRVVLKYSFTVFLTFLSMSSILEPSIEHMSFWMCMSWEEAPL